MADLDEDVILHPTSGDSAPQAEIDLSDEMQDFRFLNSLSLYVPPILLQLLVEDYLLINQQRRHLPSNSPPSRRKGL
jgi:hypothetical protein